MPEDFEPTEQVDPGDFTLQARGAVVGGVQASETFKATSKGQRPLGKGGETMGIAKRDLDSFQKQVWDESDRVRVQVIARLRKSRRRYRINSPRWTPPRNRAKTTRRASTTSSAS